MRLLLISALSTLFASNGYTQAAERIYFDEWNGTTSKDSSLYYKIWITEKQNYGEYTYYTANNKIKSIEPKLEGALHGEVIYNHSNGQLHFKSNYIKGEAVGRVITYYPNGKVHKILSYDSTDRRSNKKLGVVILDYYDSAGNQSIKDGSGEYVDYSKTKAGYRVYHGRLKHGLKDSLQVAYYPNGKLFYEEQWAMGTFKGGKSYNEQGEISEYTELETPASPKDGMAAFYRYVSNDLDYPKTARRLKVEGRVFVEFVVEKDGAISQVKVIRGIGAGCDEEAVRVIREAQKWNPGLQKGQPVRSRFNLAIIFKLR